MLTWSTITRSSYQYKHGQAPRVIERGARAIYLIWICVQDYRFYFLRTNQTTVEEIVLRIHVENEDPHPFDGGYSQEVYMN